MTKVIIDTNVLMQNHDISEYDKVYIPIFVVEELDNHKMSDSQEKAFKARNSMRVLSQAKNVEYILTSEYVLPDYLQNTKLDNKILGFAVDCIAKDSDVKFLTFDLNLKLKAESIGIECVQIVEKFKETYNGYKEVTMSEEDMADFYTNMENKFELLDKEYLVIRNDADEIVDKLKWNETTGFSKVSYKQVDNMYSGKFKPRNYQQELAFDLIQDKTSTVKVIFGKFGSGKDCIMSTHALNMVQKGLYDKIVFVRNNVEVKNSKPIGYLPGTLEDKILPYIMPFADHVGGVDGLEYLIKQGKIDMQHLGFMRGRDIKNSIIYVTEAENMTKEHIQLLISRLAEGSVLWMNGDFKQIDDPLFERNNGLKQTIDNLKGNELFGCVNLQITERSKTAQLADLLD